MSALDNEKGAALITALLLTMLSLVIAMALLTSVMMGTKMTASQKRYHNVLEASHGGVEVLGRELIPLMFKGTTQADLETMFSGVSLKIENYYCLKKKLDLPSSKWEACSDDSADPAVSPDITFRLGALPATEPSFTVTSKIVDSVPGNSDKSGNDLLDQGSSVTGNDDTIAPKQVPGLYHIAVQGVKPGAQEKARLSVLYAY